MKSKKEICKCGHFKDDHHVSGICLFPNCPCETYARADAKGDGQGLGTVKSNTSNLLDGCNKDVVGSEWSSSQVPHEPKIWTVNQIMDEFAYIDHLYNERTQINTNSKKQFIEVEELKKAMARVTQRYGLFDRINVISIFKILEVELGLDKEVTKNV